MSTGFPLGFACDMVTVHGGNMMPVLVPSVSENYQYFAITSIASTLQVASRPIANLCEVVAKNCAVGCLTKRMPGETFIIIIIIMVKTLLARGHFVPSILVSRNVRLIVKIQLALLPDFVKA